ncbi:MAG: hypothetical protein CMO98_02535 [Woeseia sp.]|nr:hypothetical protein [Woeseia sp.]|tara:strand:+ start:441 stop:1064 length:624 start_codon:yes stop_codon:yes gene_type:complete
MTFLARATINKAQLILAIFILQLPVLAQTQTAYVTDNLRLGLHQASDTSDSAFRNLESGQEMEIISRTRSYAKVRLPDGIEGYVKTAYLVFKKPAKLIVEETEAFNMALRQELTDMKRTFAKPAANIRSLELELAEIKLSMEAGENRIAVLSKELAFYRSRHDQFRYSMPMPWVGAAMLVCLVAGFLIGLRWLDWLSRKRHGGARIY